MSRARLLKLPALLAAASCGGATEPGAHFTARIDVPAVDGALLRDRVEVSGSAFSAEGISRVELQVDRGPLQAATGATPWRVALDTRPLANGPHILTAWATSTLGQTVSSPPRQVQVANALTLTLAPPVAVPPEGRAGAPLTLQLRVANAGRAPATFQSVEFVLGERVVASATGPWEVAPGQARVLQATARVPPTEPTATWQVSSRLQEAHTGAVHQGPALALPVRRRVELTSAVRATRLFDTGESLYAQTFLANFEGLTAESEMKWAQLQPQRGVFDFETADRLVEYATSRGRSVHGHVLVWSSSLPAWLEQTAWTREELVAVLEEHVRTVVGRYKGRVANWDVVNEVFYDNGAWRTADFWYRQLGPDFVEIAFRAAHEADPDALLFYNDYNAEQLNAKSNAIHTLAQQLLARGVPIHGIGLQSHVSFNYYPTQAQLAPVLQRYAALGLATRITELDVKTSSGTVPEAEKLTKQAEVYRGIAAACLQVDGCLGITTWGFTDKYTWLGSADQPLPFDVSYQPKPAWTAGLKAGLGR